MASLQPPPQHAGQKDLEGRLNREFGPGTPFYDDLCAYIRAGLQQG